MQLRAIKLANFRKFIEPVAIKGLTDGLNVLAGDNEDGKSTILHAVRTAFFTKHNTSAIAAFQPYNSSAMPEIQLEFDLGGGSHFLRKTFGRKGIAELRTPSGVFSGPDAEAKLQELCRTGSGNSNGKDSSSIWGVLWVEQGTAFDTPDVGESGRQTLSTALESELGKVLGGEDGQVLSARIKDIYNQWFTEKTGKESKNSELSLAEQNLAVLEKQFIECAQKFEEYESTLQRLQRIREQLNQHEKEKTLDAARLQLQSCLERQQNIAEKRHGFLQLQQVEKTQTVEYKALSDAFRARRSVISELEAVNKNLVTCLRELAEVEKQHADASKALFESQRSFNEIETVHEQACDKAERDEQQELHARIFVAAKNLKHALAEAKSAEAAAKEKRKAADAIKIDATILSKLQHLERQKGQAEAKLDAIATRLEFSPDAAAAVRIGDTAIDTSQPLQLTKKTVIKLDGWGSVTVCPGGTDLEKIQQAARHYAAEYEKALSVLGIKSLEEAIQLERSKNELLSEFRDCTREIQKFAPAGIAALEDEATRAQAKLADFRNTSDPSSPTSEILAPESAAKQLAESRQLREKARREWQQLKTRVQAAEENFRRIDATNQQLYTKKSQFEEQIKQLQWRLQAERDREADEVIEQKMTESRVQLEQTTAARAFSEAELKSLNADSIESEITAARQKIDLVERQIAQLTGDQRELLGALQTFGNTGVAEELQRIQGKREQAIVQTTRLRRKSQAIKLLWDTIREAEREAKDQLSLPLMKHLEPYIGRVFDDGKLIFDNRNFSLTHLHRSGIVEQYDKLSLGTREQLSVLTRLAFAQVLSDSNLPALVILDDALVYSDAERLEKMQNVLLSASQQFQVLILTCRERDYAHLPANIIKLNDCMPADKHTQLPSALPAVPVLKAKPENGTVVTARNSAGRPSLTAANSSPSQLSLLPQSQPNQ